MTRGYVSLLRMGSQKIPESTYIENGGLDI